MLRRAQSRCLGRFNKERVDALHADPYDLRRFVLGSEQFHAKFIDAVQRGQRRLPGLMSVMPTPPHVTEEDPLATFECGSAAAKAMTLWDAPHKGSADLAAAAFLVFPSVRGVHLRCRYREACDAIVQSVVRSDRKPVGPVPAGDCRKIIASCELFHRVSAGGVDPDVHALTGEIARELARAWPLVHRAFDPDGNWRKKLGPPRW